MSQEITEVDRLQAEVRRLKGVNGTLHSRCIAQAARIEGLIAVVNNYASLPTSQDINDARCFRMWFSCGAHTGLPRRQTLDEWREELMQDLGDMHGQV